ncbi:class I SAM-dependent methyltransferase [Rickettsiella endosymbiont of Rhagonycha lignosa]|uniref:class I SAM-dependent methyltransferase n=1 Tax=Rickettsiella endosymbiont of Rhagonycha lignosa TaxID=3077937 RepID=UPI00313D1E08
MIKIPLGLPVPTDALQAQSAMLCQLISDEIRHAPLASISFARFMELALYEPNLGYYTAALDKFGKMGDFTTAPEISPLFARCIGRQCQQILASLGQADILEIGAGTGQLAIDLLLFLEQEESLPCTYKILEISRTLRKRQQERLQQHIPHLFSLVEWLDEWPALPIKGVILANEVVDALPVHQFFWTEESIQEVRVAYKSDRFVYHLAPVDNLLISQLTQLQANYFPEIKNYQSEMCRRLPDWVEKLSCTLEQGLVLIIDYGFPAQEYYHPDRVNGTLLCYYQHRAHADPLSLVGLQDITASVNFSSLAQAALQSGLKVAGFTSQAAFLLNNDLLPLIEKCYDEISSMDANRQVHLLTSPSEMGELIKVMGLTRNCEFFPLNGFKFYDKRMRL